MEYLEAVIRCPKRRVAVCGGTDSADAHPSPSTESNPQLGGQGGEVGFQQIIPCHFDSPIEVGPHQFRQAFALSSPS